ncbi:Bis(5'nucleosyl)-tetraphosphatase, ApaH (plasmid) [Neorhizobium galegae bv. officinalis bv. officinalis str. HAMBI 1141]|uniref:Bis(5'nucleosyl)-tetraphosphatase, ApaH n=1 Tax=Neorhizobium galegae bv. officinalis bv. officinalis str. HAMBI 1141 TaxID=1028801 RepID=A0A068TGP3_NEOGA|nr:metallophosphoesterase family protein [Neorhizobium galegae]CDN57617.1 Bis(5'nucleosyl)-tetraphosphatase, ApaH [Neorhizobium galegae bv. officinalis bv. officinalis str. HAMBI 1141]
MTKAEVLAHNIRTPLEVVFGCGDWEHFRIKTQTPMTSRRIYAVADIHGYDAHLNSMLRRIREDIAEFPSANPIIIFLGDYIDRGPNSKLVIEKLCELRKSRNFNCVLLRGNHEQWLIDFAQDSTILPLWGRKGGLQTLRSYGVPLSQIEAGIESPLIAEDVRRQFLNHLPMEHMTFFRSLPSHFELDDYFFAHAGVDPDIPLDQQTDHDLTWIRYKFLESRKDFGKVVVHGHTPAPKVESLPNRINVDTEIYTRGVLNCVILEGKARYLLTVKGDYPTQVA